MPSVGAKLAVAGSIVFTTSMIYYVFSTQESEQRRMKKGVKKYLEENKDAKQLSYTTIDEQQHQKNAK